MENAKWILNIQWQMTGVEVQVDTNIGKHLTALGHTLTSLTGEEEEEEDVPFWKKPHPIRDHASPAKIKAISRALVGTLRTIKGPPPPPKSWREKYDSNGNPVGVPWWQCSEDTPPPSLRPKSNLPVLE